MALNIRNPEAERLAAELARETGETKTDAVTTALRDRLVRERRGRGQRTHADEHTDIATYSAGHPVIDQRAPEEILGYDASGLPR